jgi:nitrite reductase (NO-forming)
MNRRSTRLGALATLIVAAVVLAALTILPMVQPKAQAQADPTDIPVPPAEADAVEVMKNPIDIPAPLGAGAPTHHDLMLTTKEVVGKLDDGTTYSYWTFDGTVPGPLLRVRVGDSVTIHLTNDKSSTTVHSIDLHAVTGPGGGAVATQVAPGETKEFTFQAMNQGVYVYHCASPHVPTHISNGMYGLIVVEPKEGLAHVDREFYVMQGDIYTQQSRGTKGHLAMSSSKMRDETPSFVVFNGKAAGLTKANAMQAKVGERIRIFFGVGGPNVSSNFHVIGEIFDELHQEGATEAVHNVQTTEVPAGGAVWVEFTVQVPGTYTLVDHALTRALDKGAIAQIVVTGDANEDVFDAPAGTNMNGH